MITQSLFVSASLLGFSYSYPSDHSFLIERDALAITEWTAMGDSYASGVGAGEQPPDDTNRCFRFPNAYPVILNSGDGSIQPNPSKFNNVACSGNTFQQILDKEFLDEPEDDGKYGKRPAWGEQPEFVTITMGGNDIGILNLISTCVYSFKLWGQNCDQVIQEGHDIINNQQFQTDMKAVITKALDKGRGAVGPEFRLFVTGYAQFFNQETTQCNEVTFKPGWNPASPQYLTIERRTAMNGLALALNQALKSAVDGFPTQGVTYVDYDNGFEGHRFCDRDEPNPDDEDTWFFNWKTIDDPATQQLFSHVEAYSSSDSSNGFKTDADFFNALADAASNDANATSTLSDSVRVFHPSTRGHQEIRDILKDAIAKVGLPEPPTPVSTIMTTSTPSPSPNPPSSPPPYATGTCQIHVKEFQSCFVPADMDLDAIVTMRDNAGTQIGQTDESSPGVSINANNPYAFRSSLSDALIITGEHTRDYVQFSLGALSWTSADTSGSAYCSTGGWDPAQGPSCELFDDAPAV